MNTRIKVICCLLFLAISGAMLWPHGKQAVVKTKSNDWKYNKNSPTSSGPIAITSDDRYVWVANPDNNSVSVINVRFDANVKVAEVRVGKEPQNVAISPDDKWVFVSNTVSGTVSVIRANPNNPRVVQNIRVGTEPYGMAFTPNGERLYVANARSNNVSVIDAHEWRVVKTINNVGLEPRGIAITNNGDQYDDDEKVYVTQFFAVDRPGVLIGADDYKEGRVTVISTRHNRVIKEVVLNPQADTGFKSNGSALKRIPATTTTPPTFDVTTGAFPNFLNAVVIKGNKADANADFLRSGMEEVIGKAVKSGDIKIVGETYTDNWDPAKAQTEMEQFLTSNANKVDAVLAENDGMAGGVVAALAAQGLAGKVPVSGQDGDLPALNRVALGTQTVDVWKDARLLGKAAGEAAIALCKDADASKVSGASAFTTPGGNSLSSIFLKPNPISQDNLNVVLDAKWIDKATLCKDVNATKVKVCA